MRINQYSRPDNLSSLVVEYLKDKILTGELKEGDHILEANIAKELGISRAPVREGIKELQNQGLITSIPRKGNFVIKLTMEDLKEIFDIRILLEDNVLQEIIKKDILSEQDFKQLTSIIDEMVRIAGEQGDDIEKILRINAKDIEFHKYLWAKAGSPRIAKILSDLHCQLQMAMVIDTKITGNLDETAKTHYDIIKYLRLKDLDKCRKALKDHITTYRLFEQLEVK